MERAQLSLKMTWFCINSYPSQGSEKKTPCSHGMSFWYPKQKDVKRIGSWKHGNPLSQRTGCILLASERECVQSSKKLKLERFLPSSFSPLHFFYCFSVSRLPVPKVFKGSLSGACIYYFSILFEYLEGLSPRPKYIQVQARFSANSQAKPTSALAKLFYVYSQSNIYSIAAFCYY